VIKFIWLKHPTPITGMAVWGSICEPFQYVVSFDRLHQEWHSSVKYAGDRGKLIDLGAHDDEWQAKDACVKHWEQWHETQAPAQR